MPITPEQLYAACLLTRDVTEVLFGSADDLPAIIAVLPTDGGLVLTLGFFKYDECRGARALLEDAGYIAAYRPSTVMGHIPHTLDVRRA